MASFNTYLSFKRVRGFSARKQYIVSGTTANGDEYQMGFDPATESLIVRNKTTDDHVRVSITRLADSIFCADDADTEKWEPLQPAQEGFWGNRIISAHAVTLEGGQMVHISYHRRDRAPIRDWRVGQKVKNDICGPEWEAVEVYPAESRMVDTSNEYHLWCAAQLPFGFEIEDRLTQDQCDEFAEIAGMPGDGPIQRDDPDADTSGFEATTIDIKNPIRVPNLLGDTDVVG